jgi:uncharacterized protein (PEP-CTERM system associated)
MVLLIVCPAGAQETAAPVEPAPEAPPALIAVWSSGGYNAATLFSPFPKAAGLMPPSLRSPGLTPAIESHREFGVTLGATVDEQWTDNVFLTPSPKKSDFITSFDPAVSAELDTRLLKAAINYQPGYDKYATYSQLDGFRQNGIGSVDAEIIEQRLFLDGRASVSEQNSSPTGQVSAAPRTTANNLEQVDTESIAPRFQQRFDDWALAQISYHHDESHSSNASPISADSSQTFPSSATTTAALGNSQTDGGRVEVRSGQTFSQLLWDYTGDLSRNSADGTIYDQLSHTVGVEYRLNSDFGLLATGGDDVLHSNTQDLSKISGGFYSAGFHWTPSPNTELRLGAGWRYDRPNLTLLAEHHFGPMTVIRLSVNSGVTTDGMSFADALNGVERDETGRFVDPFSGLAANPSALPFARSNAIYWQRISNLVLRHEGGRDSVALTAGVAQQRPLDAATVQTAPTNPETVPIASTTVLQAALMWSHKIDPATAAVATISQSTNLTSDSGVGSSKRVEASIALDHHLNSTLLVSLSYRLGVTLQGTTVGLGQGLPTGNIRENVIIASLHKTF